MFGPWQIALIFLVILLLFGAKRLPDLAGSMGKSIKEFKKATKEDESEKLKEGEKEEDNKKD